MAVARARRHASSVPIPSLAELDAELARRKVSRPHPGPQEAFVGSAADIVVAGGAAGGGKSFGLLLAALRGVSYPAYRAVIFRRTYPQIIAPDGLWEQSGKLYPLHGAESRLNDHSWRFPSGAIIRFGHMQNRDDWRNWKGAGIPFIGFDQLEEFEAEQVWGILAWNRSSYGLPSRLLGTCNPVPEDDPAGGWLHRMLAWWIGEDGLPIQARAGVVRWCARADDGQLAWSDSPSDGHHSVTFIPARLDDNPSLRDTDYRARLRLLPLVERERLLGGNWHARPEAGKVFNRAWFKIVDAAPAEARRVRAWDKAATPGGGDFSAGLRLSEANGVYYVEHVIRGQWSSHQRNQVMHQVAEWDGPTVPIVIEQEGGSGGKESGEISVRELAGYMVSVQPVTGDKLVRAGPVASQAEAGNVRIVRGEWNEAFLAELHAFDGSGRGHDDQVDALSLAFNRLALGLGRRIPFAFAGMGGSSPEPAPEVERVRVRLG